MAVDAASLIARFPEFTQTVTEYPDLVDGAIADAELMVDRVVWGDKADAGVTHYAAHLIAINPIGEMARLDKRGEKTTYLLSYNELKKTLGLATCRVV
jgi:hypothetical protein